MGTNAAYLTALIMNLYAVKKETGVRFDGLQTYVKPAFASVLMGICVYAAYNVISAWAGNTTATLASILLGIVVYGAAVLKLKAVTASELRALPFGEFMSKIFRV